LVGTLLIAIASIAKYHQTYNGIIFNIVNERVPREANETEYITSSDINNVVIVTEGVSIETTDHKNPEQLTTERIKTTASPTTEVYFKTTGSVRIPQTTKQMSTSSQFYTTFEFYTPKTCENLETCLEKCETSTHSCDGFCELNLRICMETEKCDEVYCDQVCENEHGNCHISCSENNLSCKLECYSVC
jgi:hypothetical protein